MFTATEITVVSLSLTAIPIVAKGTMWMLEKRREHDEKIADAARRDVERSIAERATRRFVTSMATNHLPHLFNSDKKLAEGLNMLLIANGIDHRIEIDDAPPIDFVPYDPGREK